MIKPTLDLVKAALRSKDYRIYDTANIDWNLNIVGIRNRNLGPKKFDDTLVIFHKFLGEDHMTYYPVTTDPSEHYLRNPLDEVAHKGTAILKPGQYRSCYKIGMHKPGRKGGHKALIQDNPITVYRDNSRDGTLNYINPEDGNFGINIHRGPVNGSWDSSSGVYSAGCTVFADQRHFEEFMLKCKFGAEAFSNSFTYTLIDEGDL